MKKAGFFVAIIVLGMVFSACELFFPTPLVISVSFSATQYTDAQENGMFPVLFPAASAIATLRASVPDAEVASDGPVLGGTIASVTVTANRALSITGARIENVRYRLTPAGENPIGTSSDIAYIHPVYGVISPLNPNLALGSGSSTEQAVIKVNKDASSVFDVGFSSALSMWDEIDADRDGVMFPEDDNEVIEITCSLFFEGYLSDGTEFSGSFPPPLLTKIVVRHSSGTSE